MAQRPVFIPLQSGPRLVDEIAISFTWHKGMAPSQKKKNVIELHNAAAKRGLSPLLEISSKSEDRIGQRLSAFSLKVDLEGRLIPLESAYQGSKVFKYGGPFMDLYEMEAREAKRDFRLQTYGPLIGFRFGARDFSNSPKTAFYDWLYISALFSHREYLRRVPSYAGFTDIEFNPEKSINCQARSFATLIALDKQNLLEFSMKSFDVFCDILEKSISQSEALYKERQRSFI